MKVYWSPFLAVLVALNLLLKPPISSNSPDVDHHGDRAVRLNRAQRERQVHCTRLALAEGLCRTADRINQTRVSDHVVFCGKAHLRRVPKSYSDY